MFKLILRLSPCSKPTCSAQTKVYNYGERLIDRLDFEELALKSLDPSLGPKITSPRTAGGDVQQPQVYHCFCAHYLETDPLAP